MKHYTVIPAFVKKTPIATERITQPKPLAPPYKVEHGDVQCPGACEINAHCCGSPCVFQRNFETWGMGGLVATSGVVGDGCFFSQTPGNGFAIFYEVRGAIL